MRAYLSETNRLCEAFLEPLIGLSARRHRYMRRALHNEPGLGRRSEPGLGRRSEPGLRRRSLYSTYDSQRSLGKVWLGSVRPSVARNLL